MGSITIATRVAPDGVRIAFMMRASLRELNGRNVDLITSAAGAIGTRTKTEWLRVEHVRLRLAYRASGFGPVAVMRRCGTQSSTWWNPSKTRPASSSTDACSDSR